MLTPWHLATEDETVKSTTGFIVVDKDGDPLGQRQLKVYLDRERAERVAQLADVESPKLAPHALLEVHVVVQP